MKHCLTEAVYGRAKAVNRIREYFGRTGAVEVFTPYLSRTPNLDPNITPLSLTVDKGERFTAYLHTSPEYQMKKLLACLKRDIFQICHVFRDGEVSDRHTVEFMMLEWYRVGYDLDRLMEDTAGLMFETAVEVVGTGLVPFRGKIYDLQDWEKITVEEAFIRYAEVSPYDREGLYRKAVEGGLKGASPEDYETNFHLVYSLFVEPHLGKEKLTFVYGYPPEFSALAVVENGVGKRFEGYIGGLELVNGYQELTDGAELGRRLSAEKEKRAEQGRDYPIDWEFVKATENMPPSSGASLGIDRLLMVLLNKENINRTQVLNWI
ncbi:MAG: elongation factor P--(R)-beta-lysine ligase [Aquificae bacterium]|nr:elongation factor P--(R)-beta-lysine ligase [Aquificota bacterium]